MSENNSKAEVLKVKAQAEVLHELLAEMDILNRQIQEVMNVSAEDLEWCLDGDYPLQSAVWAIDPRRQ